FVPPNTWLGEPLRPVPSDPFRRRLRKWYYRWQWPRRLATYQIKLAISHFTRTWTQRWWDLVCPVLYPPVNTDFANVEKTKTILSVGRFTPSRTMDSKKQLELMKAFAELDAAHRSSWHFCCVGGVSDVPQDQDYFENVRRQGEGYQAHALASVPRARV